MHEPNTDVLIGQYPALAAKIRLFREQYKSFTEREAECRPITKVLHPLFAMPDSVEISSKKDR
jgi:hypothetical protein